MKWIIIGTNNKISHEFAENLLNVGEEIVGVISRKYVSALSFANKFNIKNKATLASELIFEYNAVYIATPNSTHYDIARRFLLLNKNIMVEKIMTDSLEKTEKLFSMAKQRKLRLMEAYRHITLPTFQNWNKPVKSMTYDFMQVSSHIKNKTYKFASTFNKNFFGGVIPDLGVYPLSLAILLMGNVKSFTLSNVKYLNGIEIDLSIKVNHQKGVSCFRISKIVDRKRELFINNKLFKTAEFFNQKFDMQHEIKLFTHGNLDKYKKVSLEVARVVQLMKKKLSF